MTEQQRIEQRARIHTEFLKGKITLVEYIERMENLNKEAEE